MSTAHNETETYRSYLCSVR